MARNRILTFRDLLGLIKDKASISKAAFLSNPHVAVLRATTHSPRAPPDENYLNTILLLGESSRATASPIITAIMDRLHRTRDCVVALKCLLIIHTIINRGPFILQDQLSIFPSSGGRNYLKLSAFRDGSSWALSAWVRFYARYLETLLSTARVLGYFLSAQKIAAEIRVSSFLNSDLIKQIDSLAATVEEICKLPDHLSMEGDLLAKEIVGLILNDCGCAVNEIRIRLTEAKERTSCLSFGESVELGFAVNRLGECRERLSEIVVVKRAATETMWGLVEELRKTEAYGTAGRLLSYGSESARYAPRLWAKTHALRFQSGRLEFNAFSMDMSVSE